MFTLFIEDQNGHVEAEYSFEGGEFIVGRSRDCDIVLPGENVSRKHARVFTRGLQCFVHDYGSTNGIIINGKKTQGETLLDVPAQIKIGDFCLHIESELHAEHDVPTGYALLRGLNLGLEGRTYRIADTVALVGRGRDCPTTIIDPSVSRVHAKFTVDGNNTLFLEDLKSANGTYVNGQAIDRVAIQSGDRVRFGNVELEVELLELSTAHSSSSRNKRVSAGRDSSSTWLSITALLLLTVGVIAGGVVFWKDLSSLWDSAGSSAKESSVTPSNSNENPEESTPSSNNKTPTTTPGTEPGSSSAQSDLQSQVNTANLVAQGVEFQADRRWAQAEGVYRKLLDTDPFSITYQTALNQAVLEKKNAEHLKSALRDRDENHHGDALRALQQITMDSVYFEEAQKEAHQLLDMKIASVDQAQRECQKKNWKGCYESYGTAYFIDPDDHHLKTLRDKIEKNINN